MSSNTVDVPPDVIYFYDCVHKHTEQFHIQLEVSYVKGPENFSIKITTYEKVIDLTDDNGEDDVIDLTKDDVIDLSKDDDEMEIVEYRQIMRLEKDYNL